MSETERSGAKRAKRAKRSEVELSEWLSEVVNEVRESSEARSSEARSSEVR